MSQTTNPADEPGALPIHDFSRSHAGLRKLLESLATLGQKGESATQAQDTARTALQSFRPAMFEHHGEEEKELFPAVLAASNPQEYGRLRALTEALTAEHRQIEALWHTLQPALEALAQGKPTAMDTALVQDIVARYAAHARLEEEQFLPMAETILGRKDPSMAALGFSLHMRHQLRAVNRDDAAAPAPSGTTAH